MRTQRVVRKQGEAKMDTLTLSLSVGLVILPTVALADWRAKPVPEEIVAQMPAEESDLEARLNVAWKQRYDAPNLRRAKEVTEAFVVDCRQRLVGKTVTWVGMLTDFGLSADGNYAAAEVKISDHFWVGSFSADGQFPTKLGIERHSPAYGPLREMKTGQPVRFTATVEDVEPIEVASPLYGERLLALITAIERLAPEDRHADAPLGK